MRSPKPESTFFWKPGLVHFAREKRGRRWGNGSFLRGGADSALASSYPHFETFEDWSRRRKASRECAFRSVRFRFKHWFGDYDCGSATAEGETMRGRQTANKYKECGHAFGFLRRECALHIESVPANGAVYRFAAADFSISCRDSDWVLKLGPPLG